MSFQVHGKCGNRIAAASVLCLGLILALAVSTGMARATAPQATTAGPCTVLNGPICVGADSACQFTNLQDAIDSASESSGEHTTIHVASDQDYTGQHLAIANRNLTIRGGYSSCSDFTPSGTTTLHGIGLDTHVVRINANAGHREVVLGNLELRDGGPAGPHRNLHGGGVVIEGQVAVTISGSTIRNNSAVSGGGIYLDGHSGAELILEDTKIVSNTAENNFYNGHLSGAGGGIYCTDGGDIIMHGGQIVGNVAVPDTNGAPHGGGVVLDHCTFSATASGEQGGVRLNIAAGEDGAGGGFFLDNALLALNGISAGAFPLQGNIAGGDGGGILSRNGSLVFLEGVTVRDNLAGFGNVDGNGGGIADLGGRFVVMMDAFQCAGCSVLEGNTATGFGAAIYSYGVDALTGVDSVEINDTLITGNGGPGLNQTIIHLEGPVPLRHVLHLNNDLITHNEAVVLIKNRTNSIGGTWIHSTTIADNTLRDIVYNDLNTSGPATLRNSIVRERPETKIAELANGVSAQCLIVSSQDGLPSAPSIVRDSPGFVDAANDNYRLLSGSHAIDFCTATPGVPGDDLDGNPRGVDAPQVPPFMPGATYDLGAYEWTAPDDTIFADGFDRTSIGQEIPGLPERLHCDHAADP